MSTTTVTKYVRYSASGHVSFGILEGEIIRELRGSIFDSAEVTGNTLNLADARLLFPEGASNVHYEAELVLVMGKKAKNLSRNDVPGAIFGVTAGNDVSERDWQKNDLQWFRAKGSDTFGPLGPAIVTGLNYDDLLVESRLNGEVRQS
jgi:2-keto-4-pentenoate hydratase/2-oxohepta-3-ene-1,7-dioic acid hydratase in catechol pathway